jgi:hypothetical protein
MHAAHIMLQPASSDDSIDYRTRCLNESPLASWSVELAAQVGRCGSKGTLAETRLGFYSGGEDPRNWQQTLGYNNVRKRRCVHDGGRRNIA